MQEFKYLPKKLQSSISELKSWLPNYEHGDNELPGIVLRILASAPGGEEAEDIIEENKKFNLGWKEIELLGNMLNALDSNTDVQAMTAAILSDKVTMKGGTMKVFEEEEEVPKKDERNRL